MAQDAKQGKPDDNILRLVPAKVEVDENDSLAGAETRIADEFVNVFGDELLYVPELGKWMLWVGTHWQEDKRNIVRHMVREICERTADTLKARRLASAKTILSVETIAKSFIGITANVDEFDRDKYKLNTPAGTINLKTGKLEPHNPADCITKITAVAPGGDCPTWRAFLDRVTNRDRDLQDFLQRIVGYSQTGETKEHAFFFIYGPGGSGKSRFVEAVSGAMGDYAKTAGMETFVAAKYDRHRAEIATLQGARLVTAIETEKGRSWAEARLKQLTGGDEVQANFMRQNPFSFRPEFKLIVVGNHAPGLTSVDE